MIKQERELYSSQSSYSSSTLQSDSLSIRHKSTTASLKDYGECYRRLGEGSSAIVMVVRKLGLHGRSEKLYAIKQFRKKKRGMKEKEFMKRLSSEFCISSTFQHPNVVQTLDLVLDEKNRYCTVMEYCPGGDLYMCIMNERMKDIEKACYLKQLLQGLAYLHSLGVAHRDIKPENLLLTMDGKLKITDFGVSDVFRFPWETKNRISLGVVGSEPYISPEAFEHQKYYGAVSDMWSAGVVFYCVMLGGLGWYKAKTTDNAYREYVRSLRINRRFNLLRSLPEDAYRFLIRLLDPNPSTRITADEALSHPYMKSIHTCDNLVDSLHRIHNHLDGMPVL
ncbi:kinase-like domain-containing protein [Pilobolus umbonatus]|nr:kinase-like domain-containing protein [Pilobolus umbonatus]